MIMYLFGVIATAIVMVLLHYTIKRNIHSSDLGFIIGVSIFSWIGYIIVIGAGIVVYVDDFYEKYKDKPIIKWKSQKKNT